MPKRINPQDRWEDDFLVPLPGEPRNIGPLEILFQKLLNRTERLKSRLAAILGLPWDATPPDTLAGLVGRVGALEANMANVSADPLPNTIALRNTQGAVQNGATHGQYRAVRIDGIYDWGYESNKWLRLARWTNFFGSYKGLLAELHISQLSGANPGTKVRVRLHTDGSGAFLAPTISVAYDRHAVVPNAVLVQTGVGVFELWGLFAYGPVYVNGVVAANTGAIELTPYGDVSALLQSSPAGPIPGGIYLEWLWAPVDQTFPGPGNIVATNRDSASGFIRYDNGMQICWTRHYGETFGSTQTSNGYTYRAKYWTFPAAFASSPVVLLTPFTSEKVSSAIASYLSHVGCVIEVASYSSASDFNVWTVDAFAIGRWR
jgi:hypothetical protein